ncbi:MULTISPECIES: peptidase M22 [unclassified Ruminococcus]|uniref:peptidase M22 n=1 Tax=unclassified Ruminococcus TaxID=2608920 RepID=UPI00210EF78E|nr:MULTISPECIES: peptidase M22 [unclassified Ruminococcus]MCQ4022254.1 peptidase M22 [Ruminococcus sp. zg-924]MCQ4114582.1 peptidase M22 [Ruminococcus sp. zg-921]
MNKAYLAFDTSNYTTSAAVYSGGEILQSKKLLPVKKGQAGLRQSDAVFHHTAQLHTVLDALDLSDCKIEAVGASFTPRSEEGSYMPCFTVGSSSAHIASKLLGVPLYSFSHQQGHIAAAVYSSGRNDLLNRTFIAFHISGGTTEAVLVSPNEEKIISTQIIAQTLDLNAGQTVDRVGLMLGLDFPCGALLEQLALKSEKDYNPKPTLKGCNCCLSGLENKCRKMLDDGVSGEDVALFCLKYIEKTLISMSRELIKEYGSQPILFAGGVMSNSIIKEGLSREIDCCFAKPEFSCDNAAGVAYLTYLAHQR